MKNVQEKKELVTRAILGKQGFLAIDAIEFDNAGNLQEVELVTLVKDAIFLLSDETRLAAFKKQAGEIAQAFDKRTVIPQYEAIYYKQCEYKK